MQTRISINGCNADIESLWDWLSREPELRGQFRSAPRDPVGGAMGTPTDLLVQTAAAGGAATMVALARSLSTWLIQRRSDVTVTGPDGRQVSVTGNRVSDPDRILRTVLEATETTGDARSPDDPAGPPASGKPVG